jgi:hypothetical protein
MQLLLQRLSTGAQSMPAAEVFVLLSLGFFAGIVASILLAAWVLHRRAHYPSPHRKLLMELEAAADEPSAGTKEPPRHPGEQRQAWERDADWWKQR